MREIDLVLSDMQNVLTERQLTILKDSMIEHFCRPTSGELMVVGEDDRVVKMFVASKTVGGRTTSSLNQYVRVLRELKEISSKDLLSITTSDIEYFLLYYSRKRKCSQSYVNSKRSYLSTFYTWAVNRGILESNPVMQVEKARLPEKEKEIFTDSEIDTLVRTAHNLRDKAIIKTLLSTECRVGELCSLNIGDLDFGSGIARVYGQKGKRERITPLTDDCISAIRQYLNERHDDSDALFVNADGSRLKKSSVQSMLTRLGKECNIHVHAHKFRRTRISQYAKKGMPLQDIAYIAGHKNMNTTYNSYVAISEDTVIEKAKNIMS